ncbi:MAG TPA: hypothetical protein VF221_00165 [Chloroflexota bacterium]
MLQGPVTASAAASTPSWVLDNPTPWVDNLLGLACPAATTCVAVGAAGIAILTDDSGKTWRRGATGTTARLLTASCPSTSICYAAGTGGLVIRTVDGGKTWKEVKRQAALDVSGIACPTSTTCLVADGRNVLRTIDGGRSWTQRTPHGPSWNAITCVGERACYAAGGSIITIGDSGLGTTDGVAFTQDLGQHWQVQDISIQGGETMAYAVGCYAATCLAVGTSAHGRFNPAPGDGLAWDVPRKHTGHGVSQWPLRGVACLSATTCVAVGDRGTIVRLDSSGRGLPLAAGNPLPISIYLTAVSCPAVRVCYAVGTSGAIIRSADTGRHWTILTHTIAYDGLTSVSCARTVCYASGGGTVLRRTIGSWAIVRSGVAGGLDAISCPTDEICYAAGGTSVSSRFHPEILTTPDGGRTWQRVATPIDGEVGYLSAIRCPTADVCYALGQMQYNVPNSHPVFLTVTNGGRSVHSSALPTGDQVGSLACPALDVCSVTHQRGGFDGGIIRTNDGGSTWTPITGMLPNTHYGPIACPDAHTCYVAGVNESLMGDGLLAVLATTHDGESRSDTRVPYENGLYGVGCATVRTCYAVGSGGRILRTGDGGATWLPEVSHAADGYLEAVACLGVSTCYAVGVPGITLHRTGP